LHLRSIRAKLPIQELKASVFRRSKETPYFSFLNHIALKSPLTDQSPAQLEPIAANSSQNIGFKFAAVGPYTIVQAQIILSFFYFEDIQLN
jgi:hypothetical protein